MLLNAIRENKSDFKQPDISGWAKEMHVILYGDKREPNAVADVISYAQGDNIPRGDGGFCWSHVILTPWALRKHFDRLQLEMEKNVTGFLDSREAETLRTYHDVVKQIENDTFDLDNF
jgi:hypothetical protein